MAENQSCGTAVPGADGPGPLPAAADLLERRFLLAA